MSNRLRSLRSPKLFISILALILALPLVSAKSQFFFGRNKVQYASFDWKVMTTEHFKIYFYEDEKELANIAAQTAEESYGPLAAKFNHEVLHKIPLIIYSAPHLFAQTNTSSGMIPESVAGFTEFLKGRVVIPFDGSYYRFAHVIRHELVHVFMISRLQTVMKRQGNFRYSWPPLWFTEGLAENWSEEWDVEADMILKDMVLTNSIPPISQFWRYTGSYFMYKLGQSLCRFIDIEYGRDKLTRLFDNWVKASHFEQILALTVGESIDEISAKWTYWLKKEYYPEIETLGLPRMESTRLTYERISIEGVPIQWDDGKGTKDWLVYLANDMGYSGLYMKPRNKSRKHIRNLVKGERSAKFESMHLLRSSIDANDSGLVIFSSLSKERDYLYLYDLNKKRIAKRLEFPDLITVRSPRLSPDSKKAVFEGAGRNGLADIYIVDLETGDYRSLMNDLYFDTDPAFSLDGEAIIYSSDRSAEGADGAINLYRYDLKSEKSVRLTFGRYTDLAPDPHENGIYFSSDREGVYNIFRLLPNGDIVRTSALATGAFDPRVTTDNKHITFTGFQGMAYSVYSMKMPEVEKPVEVVQDNNHVAWKPKKIDSKITKASIKYETDYSFDIAQSSVGYDPVYGSMGGVQGLVSDMLGDHMYHFVINNTSETQADFLKSINVGVSYINRKHRLNWGAGVYHLYDEYYNDYESYYNERQVGMFGLLRYPYSRFMRFDLSTYLRYSNKDRRFGLKGSREVVLSSNLISWIYDNSLWDHTGPIEGRRYNFTIGLTVSAGELKTYNRFGYVDVRHYLRLGKYSAFANRMFAYSSAGIEPQRIYFGGSWSFRGYSRRELYVRNVLFMSNELRFPLVDNLFIGLPIGGFGFRAIRGAVFFDVGSMWDDNYEGMDGSLGVGFRVNLGYLVLLRFDFSRRTDFEKIDSITDFDFFFGWNF